MVCLTPVIELPDELLTRLSLIQSALSKSEAGDEKLQFHVGFSLDGVLQYTDLRDSGISELAYVTVVPIPPEFQGWQEAREYTGGPIAIHVREGNKHRQTHTHTHTHTLTHACTNNIYIYGEKLKNLLFMTGRASDDWMYSTRLHYLHIRSDMCKDRSLRERGAMLSP